jgi:putative AlgH/UPF0301 family transcriptional regulator
MLSLKGQAMIAAHSLDSNKKYARSVWVVLDHTDTAVTALCLSRIVEPEIEFDLRKRFLDIPERVQILRGGSTDGFEKHMIFIHQNPEDFTPSVEIAPGFSISMNHENIFLLRDVAGCKIALGFENWDPHRLERECQEGTWILRDINHIGKILFQVHPEELWSCLQAN